MPREHTAVVKFLSLEKLGSLKLYSLKCLYTKCIPKLFAGNERSEFPERGGDLKCIPKLFAGNERSEFPEKGGDLRGGYEIAKDANADYSKSPILTTNYKGAGLLDLIRVLRTSD
jgi:hypothetical protein